MLTIEPLGGLCNRMRALDSAFALARALRYPVKILWNIDATLGCRFEELFYRPAVVPVWLMHTVTPCAFL